MLATRAISAVRSIAAPLHRGAKGDTGGGDAGEFLAALDAASDPGGAIAGGATAGSVTAQSSGLLARRGPQRQVATTPAPAAPKTASEAADERSLHTGAVHDAADASDLATAPPEPTVSIQPAAAAPPRKAVPAHPADAPQNSGQTDGSVWTMAAQWGVDPALVLASGAPLASGALLAGNGSAAIGGLGGESAKTGDWALAPNRSGISSAAGAGDAKPAGDSADARIGDAPPFAGAVSVPPAGGDPVAGQLPATSVSAAIASSPGVPGGDAALSPLAQAEGSPLTDAAAAAFGATGTDRSRPSGTAVATSPTAVPATEPTAGSLPPVLVGADAGRGGRTGTPLGDITGSRVSVAIALTNTGIGEVQQAAAAPPVAASEATPDNGTTEVINQITSQLAGSLGAGKLDVVLRLHPPELGELNVRMQVDGRAVTAWFQSPAPQVQQALSQGMEQLQAGLANAGFSLTDAWIGGDAWRSRGGATASRPPRPLGDDEAAPATTNSAAAQGPAIGVSLYV
jgi:flagellar hook-length control protein FliK